MLIIIDGVNSVPLYKVTLQEVTSGVKFDTTEEIFKMHQTSKIKDRELLTTVSQLIEYGHNTECKGQTQCITVNKRNLE